jgi:hypothetical protein
MFVYSESQEEPDYVAMGIKNEHDRFLIMAAPDLLEALTNYRNWFRLYVNTLPAYQAIERAADAAIAKAGGKA